ncbi:Cytoplasmic dynein 2 light intermediate chain 1 [Strongyloides ratti]|uniref:Cytoplasmic dynein 2 light intermediate chain 1 n=1 Tax=Strongyloides ratti TaxID=34506 RepID=A0A090MZQ7_STRRB|nr:Cytoplasmic dynein 2 light intermediate chain 1 [Strongyloides ratti]CEF69354.1 Cytoplasmic dynein 2 light intermediate chain 1 [Strongyloides ratti]
MNIWELAEQKIQENKSKRNNNNSKNDTYSFHKDPQEPIESYIIIAGYPKTGKTTYLNRFLKNEATINPTTILEYSFGYRHRDSYKDIIHTWELSIDHNLSSLLHVPFTKSHLQKNIGLFIVFDLTKPETIWIMIEEFLKNGKQKIEDIIIKEEKLLKDYLEESSWERIGGRDVLHNNIIKPFPIPLYFIGGKYDIFQNEESEKRKNISFCLRLLNLIYGGCLMYSSINMENLVSRIKSMMSNVAFKINYSKGLAVDINQALFIPFGGDSLESICSLNNKHSFMASTFDEVYDECKKFYNNLFPQELTKLTSEDDIINDEKFSEPIVDMLFEERLSNLQRYIKENEQREATIERTSKNNNIFF